LVRQPIHLDPLCVALATTKVS